MAFPAGGYEYEADAITDGVIHYWSFFNENGGTTVFEDYIGDQVLTIQNSNPQNTIKKDANGYYFDATANGVTNAHNYLTSSPVVANDVGYVDWAFYKEECYI